MKFIEFLRKHRKLVIFVLIFALLDTGLVYMRIYKAKHGMFRGELLGPYKVTKVSDGDTLWIRDSVEYPYGKKVRLIGVDCPESVAPESYLESTGKSNTTAGQHISDYVERIMKGKDVYLEFDVRTEDKYGRLLAYVFLDPNGNEMLQDILISKGFAQLDTVPPNVKYEQRFYKLQMEARQNEAGIWSDIAEAMENAQ